MSGTAVDALNDATAALNVATQTINALEGSIAAKATASQTAATTVINNFLARPSIHSFYVDPVNGSDANDGSTPALAFKTVDAALDAQPHDGTTTFYLLADVVIGKYRILTADTHFYGAQLGIGAAANQVSHAQRTMTFASEASNSPVPGVGRVAAGFQVLTPTLTFETINAQMGSPDPALVKTWHLECAGASVQMMSCFLDAPAGSGVSWIKPVGGSQSHLWFLGSLGVNAPGRIFQGYAAGSNGNQSYIVTTNLSTV